MEGHWKVMETASTVAIDRNQTHISSVDYILESVKSKVWE